MIICEWNFVFLQRWTEKYCFWIVTPYDSIETDVRFWGKCLVNLIAYRGNQNYTSKCLYIFTILTPSYFRTQLSLFIPPEFLKRLRQCHDFSLYSISNWHLLPSCGWRQTFSKKKFYFLFLLLREHVQAAQERTAATGSLPPFTHIKGILNYRLRESLTKSIFFTLSLTPTPLGRFPTPWRANTELEPLNLIL
jgi:hypothetical protein